MPEELYRKMRQAIRGYRLPIDRIQGKWKMNQNRTEADRDGVIKNLKLLADPAHVQVADVMTAKARVDEG